MAKVFNLTSLLKSEQSTIIIGEKTYTVTNSMIDMFTLDELNYKKDGMSTREFLSQFFSIALGKEAANEIMSANYSIELCYSIIDAIQEAMQEESIVDNNDQNA